MKGVIRGFKPSLDSRFARWVFFGFWHIGHGIEARLYYGVWMFLRA
jgi:hypothetical protein